MSPENHFSSSETSSTPWDDLQNIKFSDEQPKNPNLDSNVKTPEKLPIITTSPNRTCNWYLREIENLGHMENLKSFITDATSRTYEDLSSPQELNNFCTAYNSKISPFLTHEAKSTIKHYSGLGYKAINQVARGFWDYEILGRQTPEKLAQTQQDIKNLSQIIASLPPLDINLATYRGTNLDAFQSYQIQNLSELKNLEHSFFLETGFTSTSLSRDSNFTNRQFDNPLRKPCDIEIKYLLASENDNCVDLFSDDLSYSKNQHEILLNRDSLSYISKVQIDQNRHRAFLEMLLLPTHVYDPVRS